MIRTDPGRANTEKSVFIPIDTNKNGIKNPYPMLSNRLNSNMSCCRTTRDSPSPAMNDPTMKLIPTSSPARAANKMISRNTVTIKSSPGPTRRATARPSRCTPSTATATYAAAATENTIM